MTTCRLALLKDRLKGWSFEVRFLEGQQTWLAHAYHHNGRHYHAGHKDMDACLRRLVEQVHQDNQKGTDE